MKKKIAALLGSLMLMLGLTTAMAPPVVAAQTIYDCMYTNEVSSCAQVQFERQSWDGTGVYVNYVAIRMQAGCDSLNDVGPNSYIGTNGQTNLDMWRSDNWYADCSTNHWVSRAGQDDGNLKFTLWLKVDRNWWRGGDHMVFWQWRLYPSGNSVLIDKGWRWL